MKSSLDPIRPFGSGYNRKRCPWSSVASVRPWSLLGRWLVGEGSHPLGKLCSGQWNLHTFSISHWLSWPLPHLLANWDSILLWWSLSPVICQLLLLLLGLVPRRKPASSDEWVEKKATHSTCVPWPKGRFPACLLGSRRIHPGSIWEKLWAPGGLSDWWGCWFLWFSLAWSCREVSPWVFYVYGL